MRTDPDEFARWHTCFPSEIRKGLWFFPVRFHPTDSDRGKAPEVPKGESWKDSRYRLSFEEAEHRLEVEKNVGVAAHGDIAVGDVDNIKRAVELKLIPDDLVDTLIVRTRDLNLHLYYINDGVGNEDYIENKIKIIELRSIWRYVLSPGSWVPPTPGSSGDGLYRVVNEKTPLVLKPGMLRWQKPKNDHSVSAQVNYDGAFVSLPCIKAFFRIKFPVGYRRRIGKFLSLAWLKDYGSANGFMKFVEPFARFQDIGHTHRASEYNWIPTIQNKKIEWNCGEIITLFRSCEIFPTCSGCPLKMGKIK